MKYKWTEDMNEISGFGGSYEAACRAMVKYGLEWWDAHPTANPQYRGYKSVMGLCDPNNSDADELDKAMSAGADSVDPNGGVTGAMHQAAVSCILYIKKTVGIRLLNI